MTEEAKEQTFSQYVAAKRGVAALGLSECVDAEEGWEIAPTSSASRLPNLVPFSLGETKIVTAPTGVGKTHLLLEFCRAASQPHRFSQGLSEALVNSVTVRLFKAFQGDSMATQQPSSADEQTFVHQLIWQIATAFHLPYRTKLASRLSELQNAVQEEQEDGRGMSLSSLQSFFQFIGAYPSLRYPNITVTPDRTIYASWKSGRDRVFSIHFLSEGIRFVIFSPNPKHPRQTIRTSGTATLDVIMSIAAPYSVLEWASQ